MTKGYDMTILGTDPQLGVDPGNVWSAWVIYDPPTQTLINYGYELNARLLERILLEAWDVQAGKIKRPLIMHMELVQSMGMAVGQTVFNTCIWSGRFVQAWLQGHDDRSIRWVSRREEKLHLCGNMRAKDANIRQAIIDRYGSTKQVAQGTKKNPGPLYGVSKDVWAALAVVITGHEAGKYDDHNI
jgi:hypothetical protein